jgi:hypothetical protein
MSGYTELEKLLGKLRIKLTPAGREELEGQLLTDGEEYRDSDPTGYQWKRGHNEIFHDLLEDHLCNGWEMVPPEDIGALTSSPILSDSAVRDDDDKLTSIGDVYWFPEYQVKSELEELLEKGFVDFTLAE